MDSFRTRSTILTPGGLFQVFRHWASSVNYRLTFFCPFRDISEKHIPTKQISIRSWIDQRIFEVFGRCIRVSHIEIPPGNLISLKSGCIGSLATIRVPRIELPLIASTVITVCVLLGNVLLTRLQTDRQTNLFDFLRPSFQSRERELYEVSFESCWSRWSC